MKIDFPSILPLALKFLFPDETQRTDVTEMLHSYGSESFHKEIARVRLGVLYLASKKTDQLEALIKLACSDYRDLLCEAEYPHSSRRWRLKDINPDKYKKLQFKEQQEYLSWVNQIVDRAKNSI